MNKKVVSLLLAMMVAATTLAGCNFSADLGDDVEVTVDSESEQESEEESTDAASEAESEAASEADSEAAADTDWSTAYDNYFDENSMLRDNSQLVISENIDGLTIGMITAISGDNFRMLIDFGTASIDVYSVDGKAYAKSVMEGQEAWTCATLASEEDSSTIKNANPNALHNENIVSYTYRCEETVDGVVYDVLDMVVTTDGENANMLCYINRETQKISKYVVEEEGKTREMLIEDIDGIELPAEAANATECSAEDIATSIMATILVGALSSAETTN